ncbi:DUF3576 domain-containing protein [Neogemmobacter tilapiae]|uniref:DUF3576 domain-containing protein n=1 Tax=Neogemmobacter tilapiae TaxID=875041 RepID=A0A918TN03_9RHOB|nr:DUF3576 domain-containing protein [Gemmobacter tilapiae]GHC55542.1 hypothetical protein GCM10007315_18140 [Gemmobacter tilapiae]
MPVARFLLLGTALLTLSACGGGIGSGNLFGGNRTGIPSAEQDARKAAADEQRRNLARNLGEDEDKSTIWDLFGNRDDPNTTVEVNKYLWNASLDVLNFLPIQSVDPFTGVIVTGYGTPPGGGRAYRATIYVQDPALDARSLKVSLQGSGGQAVAPAVAQAVEDAILTRARELRVQDSKL